MDDVYWCVYGHLRPISYPFDLIHNDPEWLHSKVVVISYKPSWWWMEEF